ncbi:hypothetical protein [Phenylobacterium deserti]|uniref:Uncharacterized protein n=1 Tax=Phenylobacterium deserti TaxID=1914756 RepID=A0A328ADI8_9CAUL|nr:hypothetical protein [Phenylobacterium deserti]RAK52711.1 hypothetical protein DJ018_10995 [Phenylobacterium deserti]
MGRFWTFPPTGAPPRARWVTAGFIPCRVDGRPVLGIVEVLAREAPCPAPTRRRPGLREQTPAGLD